MNVCGQEIRIQRGLIRIAELSADTFEYVDDPETTVDSLRRSEDRIDLFTFMQRLPDTSPKYTYPLEWDNLAVLPISTFDNWWTKQVNDKTRNMARRAGKKGVVIRELSIDDAFIRGVWTIYNECEVRQGKPFPHYGKDLETVRKETATFLDRSVFFGAYLDDTLIGFAKLHCHGAGIQAGLVSILSLVQHRDKSPTNALVAEAVRYCASKGIPNLIYSRFSDGNKEGDSLMEFKEHNGFQRVNLPRYYVPLNPFGWAAFHLGMHHRIADHIPEPVLAKLRGARSLWYTFKLNVHKHN